MSNDAAARPTLAERSRERVTDLIDRPTRRRAGVFRRALRHEFGRLRDRRRLASLIAVGVVGGFILACLIARGEASGSDARAYWAAARLWLNGGDPYHPSGPFMPYVYSPWMLPFFVPWALLPWEVAWFVWRGATVLGFLWTFDWAYRRRPGATTLLVIALALPLAANIDTGNINLPLAILVFGAEFMGPRMAGFWWAIATAMKWAPATLLPLLSPRSRLWGIGWLVVGMLLTIATLPATLVQLQVLFGFPRPPRVDYLVFVWACVPWLWQHPRAFWWLAPATWPRIGHAALSAATVWASHWRRSPERTADAARRVVTTRFRGFFGLRA